MKSKAKHIEDDDTLYILDEAPLLREFDPDQQAAALPPPKKKRPRIEPGQRYGRLTVIRQGESEGYGKTWVCRCDCGTAEHQVRGSSLTSGATQSCGCLRTEARRERAKRGKGAGR